MTQYVIEREIPDIGSADQPTLRGASGKSNDVLDTMRSEDKNIKWLHSYVAADRTFCIYEADDAELIQEHARRSGFPATRVFPITRMISPATAQEH